MLWLVRALGFLSDDGVFCSSWLGHCLNLDVANAAVVAFSGDAVG